jgi:hypothetical protein
MKRLIGVVLLSLAGAGVSAQDDRRSVTDEQQRLARAEVERLRAERGAFRALASGVISLDEAARQAGGYLRIDASPNPDYFSAPDLATLSRKSVLVIVGRPYGTPRVGLSDDKRRVVTQYDVQVDEVLRGRGVSQLAASVVLEVPGGRLAFANGAVAEVVNGPNIQIGESYLLYLQFKSKASGFSHLELGGTTGVADKVYILSWLQQEGIFRVSGNEVVSLAPATHALKRRYDGRPVERLLTDARVSK